MKVIYEIGKVSKKIKNAVVVIGVFDGVHKGHQALIGQALRKAKTIKGEVVVMTFSPHPVHVLNPQRFLPLIVSLSHRIKLIKQLGVSKCIVVRFTKRFAQLAPEKFIRKYLVDHIQAKEIFVGDDFRFGKDRSGSLDLFRDFGKRFGFGVNGVVTIKGNSEKISSSEIRLLIEQGQLHEAECLLGRKVSVLGVVKKGDQRGRSLGFPTANIYPQKDVVLPRGVYAVNICIGSKKYKGMANVGVRPSFNKSKKNVNIEVHIFDFKKNLYGKEVIVEFVDKIRNEQLFPSQKELILQLNKDQQQALSLLK